MHKVIVGSIAVAGLLLASCGSSDGGSSSTSKVDQVVDKLASVVSEQGGTIDRDCAKEQVAKMSDADLQTLIDSKVEDDVTLSDEGEAIGDAITSCITAPADTASATSDTTGDTMADAAGSLDGLADASTDEQRAGITDMLVSTFGEDTIDRACVEGVVGQFSDEDLAAIIEAGDVGDPAFSPDGAVLATKLIECVTDFTGMDDGTDSSGTIPSGIAVTPALIDLFVEQLESTGMKADRACVEQALDGVDVAQLGDVMNDPALLQSLTACVTP